MIFVVVPNLKKEDESGSGTLAVKENLDLTVAVAPTAVLPPLSCQKALDVLDEHGYSVVTPVALKNVS